MQLGSCTAALQNTLQAACEGFKTETAQIPLCDTRKEPRTDEAQKKLSGTLQTQKGPPTTCHAER